MPNPAATAQPATMPIIGAHRRSIGVPRKVSTATTISVASAVTGAATGSASDASSSRPKTTDASVIESIIITVPPTVGVTSRLSRNSHLEITSWMIPETNTRVIRVAGPPSTTAVMQNGIEKAAVNIGRTAPAPTGPTRFTCSSVESPTTISEAKTIHAR